MGLFDRNSAKRRQPGNGTPTPTAPPPQPASPDPNTGPLPIPPHENSNRSGLQKVDGGVNLVNYSPEQMMQQIDQTLSHVHFGMNKRQAFKEWSGEIWDLAAPIVLLVGTVGEVFFFIWNNTTETAAWWVAMSVLATVIVLETTFAVTSYKSSSLRNRADRRPGGRSALDKKVLKNYRIMWFVMAAGVGFGQAAFLISAMGTRLTNPGLLIAFAIIRSLFTLAADFYTAFVHVEKPTEAEEATHELEERATATQILLKQKNDEIEIINDGALKLQRTHAKAVIEQDNTVTEIEMSKMENQTRLQNHRTMQEQADTMNRLGQGMLRAIFDPEMPHEQRQAMLQSLEMLVSMSKQILPPREPGRPGRIDRIDEERDV